MRTVGGLALTVVDAHTHLSAARCGHAIELMDRNGIDVAIDVSPNVLPTLEAKLRAFAAHGGGRLFACCGADPSGLGRPGWADRACRELERAVADGAVGIKFAKEWGLTHADHQGRLVPIDDEHLAPVFDTAGRLGIPVVFHTADPRAFFDPPDENNERREELGLNPGWSFSDRTRYPMGWWQLIRKIEKVITRHPGCRFVGAHFGCAAEEPGYVAEVIRDNGHYSVDTAARIGEVGRHPAAAMRSLLEQWQDRVLFGTDLGVREQIMLGAPQDFAPGPADVDRFYQAHWRWFETSDRRIDHPTPIQGRWTVDGVGLPAAVLRKIYGGNALSVFSRIQGGPHR